MFRALSMNEIYSNGLKLYPFSGHSGFKVIHWETIERCSLGVKFTHTNVT